MMDGKEGPGICPRPYLNPHKNWVFVEEKIAVLGVDLTAWKKVTGD